MAEFCRSFDEDLWEGMRDQWILCEGHGLYEYLDAEGRPTKTLPFNTPEPPVRFEAVPKTPSTKEP